MHRRTATLAATALMMLSTACDAPEPACPVTMGIEELYSNRECLAAQRFAARDAADLVATQIELDRYHDRWTRAVQAEPVLHDRVPQAYRGMGWSWTVSTTDSAIITAWRAADVLTGHTDLDGALARVGAQIQSTFERDGELVAGIDFGFTFNEEQLAVLFERRSITVPPRIAHPRDDGMWSWLVDGSAEIDFAFGWGDCIAGCEGMRYLKAIVPTSGAARVYDLGGDELPEGLSLSPDTKPLN